MEESVISVYHTMTTLKPSGSNTSQTHSGASTKESQQYKNLKEQGRLTDVYYTGPGGHKSLTQTIDTNPYIDTNPSSFTFYPEIFTICPCIVGNHENAIVYRLTTKDTRDLTSEKVLMYVTFEDVDHREFSFWLPPTYDLGLNAKGDKDKIIFFLQYIIKEWKGSAYFGIISFKLYSC